MSERPTFQRNRNLQRTPGSPCESNTQTGCMAATGAAVGGYSPQPCWLGQLARPRAAEMSRSHVRLIRRTIELFAGANAAIVEATHLIAINLAWQAATTLISGTSSKTQV
jgi:hypothetical protein